MSTLGRAVRCMRRCPRQRLKVDSGVAITSRTVNDPKLIALAGRWLGDYPAGVANVRFRRIAAAFRDFGGQPRFAGAMSLTVHAGPTFRRWLSMRSWEAAAGWDGRI